MKIFLYTILLVSIISLLSSCEKVINLKLNSSTPHIVISGIVTDQPGSCQVSIGQTTQFNDSNGFKGMHGAIVTIEHDGSITPLSEVSPGIYQNNQLTGIPGDTYHLTVLLNGSTYQSYSTMPLKVALDSIYIANGIVMQGKFVTVVFSDPLNIKNYYRFIQYINGKKDVKSQTLFVWNDELIDGKKLSSPLEYDFDKKDSSRIIKSGDQVKIEMLGLDANVYKYWFSASQGATGDGQSSAPANPVSNITGGALGYFSAQTFQSKQLLVP